MSVSTRMLKTPHPRSLARRLWLGSSLLGVAALAACSTVSLQPGQEGYGSTYGSAPVVESSMYSDGRLVAAPGQIPGQQPYTPIGQGGQPYTGAPVDSHGMPIDPAATATAPLSGLHLQAGTFSSQTSAENVAANIRSKVPQFAQRVSVMPRGSNWRVLIGPFASDAERMQAAGVIRSAIGSDVVNAAP